MPLDNLCARELSTLVPASCLLTDIFFFVFLERIVGEDARSYQCVNGHYFLSDCASFNLWLCDSEIYERSVYLND